VALRLKYGGKIGLARVIAQQLLRHVPDETDQVIITPVPLHWTRIWSRSFNQSALIGKHLKPEHREAAEADLARMRGED
jgi:predicted amidophosphoribosyltransferase